MFFNMILAKLSERYGFLARSFKIDVNNRGLKGKS